jgi:DHA2 family multidrug resistance protein
LGSETIVTFTIVSVVALTFLIVNEKYHEHPIVNLSLFRDRSFTSGCTVMFFVFFNLFGSIVLLPIFLQVLMGYTSFYAGLVMGPGGLAALFTMPIVGRLVTRVNPKAILATGIIICAGTTYAMSLFNLQTDFWTFVWPRVTLGMGMACIFIPTTTLTLSHIPKEKMGEATSIYNMIRNLGGSMGIAFAFTVAARRAQFHQARLVENLTPLNPNYFMAKAKAAAFLSWNGTSLPPEGAMYRELIMQSNMLGFNDAFFIVAVTLTGVLGLVLIIQKPEPEAGGGH